MSAAVVAALASLYLLLAVGWGLRRLGKVDDGVPDALNLVVTEVTMPVLIVMTLMERRIEPAMAGAVGASLVGLLAALGAAWVVGPRVTRTPQALGSFLLAATFCNTGFLGIPVALAMWGPGSEGLVTAVMVDSFTTTLLLNTVGVWIALRYGAGGRFDRAALGRLVLAPMFLAVPVGLGLQLAGVTLPDAVRTPLTAVGGATSTLVFLATGMRLRFAAVWAYRRAVAAVAAVRFLVSPAAALAVVWALGLDGETARQAVLEVAMSTALMAPVIAGRYGCDPELGPAAVAATTALVPVSIVGWLGVCAALLP